MSEYGRLWQRVSDIRHALKRLAPALSTETLKLARASVVYQREARGPLDLLLNEWERLEVKMAQTDD